VTETDQLDWGWNQMGHSDWSVFVSWSAVPNYFVRTKFWAQFRLQDQYNKRDGSILSSKFYMIFIVKHVYRVKVTNCLAVVSSCLKYYYVEHQNWGGSSRSRNQSALYGSDSTKKDAVPIAASCSSAYRLHITYSTSHILALAHLERIRKKSFFP
jgi:hypothetical protein